MITLNFIKAVIVGLVVAFPVGPHGIYCIQATLQHGRRAGFAAAMGGTVCDIIAALVALLSTSIINDFIMSHQRPTMLVGGAIVVLIGALMLARPSGCKARGRCRAALPANTPAAAPLVDEDSIKPRGARFSDFFQGLAITITNPSTLISMLFFCTLLRIDTSTSALFTSAFLGIAAASFSIMTLTVIASHILRRHLTTAQTALLTKILSVALILTGLYAIVKALCL